MRTNQDSYFWNQNNVNKELRIYDEQTQHMIMFSPVISLHWSTVLNDVFKQAFA